MTALGYFLRTAVVWLLTVTVGVGAVVFAINNRAAVVIDFSPFGFGTELPVYAIFFVGLALGAMLAGLAGGYSLVRWQVRASRASREASAAMRQLERVRARGAELEARLREWESEPSGADPAGLPAIYSRTSE